MFDSESAALGGQLAGYRMIRRLARDAAAEVILGFRESDEAETSAVVLKVFPATAHAWSSLVVLAEALERASGDHVVPILDFSATDESICVVFERLTRGDLAGLLHRRQRLDAGEAVTILAPLAATVARMHRAGVSHGALSARTVLFRDDGAPVMIGFGQATLFSPGAPEVDLERERGVCDDRAALRSLAAGVLARVTGARASAARELIDRLESCADELVPSTLEAGVFAVAAALPVQFIGDGQEFVEAFSGELRPVPVVALPLPGHAGDEHETGNGRVVAARRWLAAQLGWLRTAAVPVTQRWQKWSTARRRLTAAGMAGAVAIVVVVGLVPSGTSSPTAAPTSSSPTETTTSPDVVGDDPVAAASALLDQRRRCLRDASLLCLDDVDQADSSALRADREQVIALQKGGERNNPLSDFSVGSVPVLVERLGDSALLSLGPADTRSSILLVKSANGWRIRDLISDPASSGQKMSG